MKKQKTSSLTWRICGYIQWRQLGRLLGSCLALCATALAAWSLALEWQEGPVKLLQWRRPVWTGNSLYYTFSPRDSRLLCRVELLPLLRVLGAVIAAVALLGLIRWGLDWLRHERALRDILRPIDRAALAAERISAGGIDPSRLHTVEQAIDSIHDSEDAVCIGDKDLQGLESAINNLLRRLRASYEAQTRFVDDASHELRTPIAVIHGYAAILERWGKDDPATLEESIRAILEESEHMQTLVEQLLFLARGDGGRQALELHRLDAAALLREVKEESEMIDADHVYALPDTGPAWVMGDAGMLKQAVRILTDNAVKYTPAGGQITLSVRAEAQGQVGLCVQDEGVGLSPEEAEHMFERFFRGDAVRGSTRGSGLGLSIAQWIVERHHGHIRAVGCQGVGTRVTLCLPDAGAAEPAPVN